MGARCGSLNTTAPPSVAESVAVEDHLGQQGGDGLVTLTVAGRELARASQVSSCRDSTPPLRGRFGSEDPQRRSGDQVALKIEVVVDGSVDAEEALGRSG
jgi:hypothetical protein